MAYPAAMAARITLIRAPQTWRDDPRYGASKRAATISIDIATAPARKAAASQRARRPGGTSSPGRSVRAGLAFRPSALPGFMPSEQGPRADERRLGSVSRVRTQLGLDCRPAAVRVFLAALDKLDLSYS